MEKLKLLNRIENTLFLSLIIYLLFFIPVLFKYKPLVILTESMTPNYKAGSVTFYKNSPQLFQAGDVIVFDYKGELVTHRIIDVTNTGYITKGDSNNIIDSNEIIKEKIIGKVIPYSIPFVGYVLNFIYKYKLFIIIYILLSWFLKFIIKHFRH